MDEQRDRQINKSRWVEVREFKGLGGEPIGTVPLKLREEKIKRWYISQYLVIMMKVEDEKQEIESSLINFKEQFSKVERNQGNVNESIENSIHRIKEGTK